MNTSRPNFSGLASRLFLLITAVLATVTAQAGTINVNVVDNDGTAVDGFRWVLQHDATFAVDPNNPSTDPDELLSLGFHASYHPVAQNGNSDTDAAAITTGPGRYYVSVLPYSGYSISGGQAEIKNDADTATVTVTVQKHPIPTAQIAIYLFQDNYPLNGAPDLPEETNPLPGVPGHVDWTKFNIVLEEPAGRYGQAGGPVIRDAFNNPLGTIYEKGCDADGQPDADPFTNFGCLDADGMPIIATDKKGNQLLGDGTLSPEPDGTLLIENLAPAKYGIIVVPPSGQGWQQSSTIEGTPVIDAWVKANEPPFFVEFGPPGPHVFIGFTKEFNYLSVGGGTATISGTITDMHMSRAPAVEFFSGRPVPGCWIGVNESNPAGLGRALYAGPCNADSTFSIPFVRPGSYQLKVFDTNLDVVIASQGFTVDPNGSTCNGGGSCDFGEVAVFNWFARLNTGVFNDTDQDGFWDAGEAGIGPESQSVSVRWRDGTIYQSFPTDGEGFAPFDEVFPFFHWLVAEVSFANKKATGATFVVDAGGFVDKTTEAFPGFGELTPQAQFMADGTTALPDCDTNPDATECTVDGLSRTERGPVLTTAFQAFLGQTNVLQFGKADYKTTDYSTIPPTFIGENGGISGIVYYATTRAEDEPELAAAEVWEPGVPRVQVNLYADGDIDSFPVGDFPNLGPDGIPGTADDTYGDVDWNDDGFRDLDDDVIDDIDGVPGVNLADVDNYPFDWYCQGEIPCIGDKGDEDIDRNGNGAFDLGDAVQVAWTDSWDDNLPTGCQGANNVDATAIGLTGGTVDDNRCFDGLRNFNQVRPGVFDGGYAFADYDMAHLDALNPNVGAYIQNYYDAVNAAVADASMLDLGLIPGDYIVEAVTPPGYKLIKEEDKNVDFGDQYIPSTQALAARCVGDDHTVPPYLSMATKDGSGASDQLIAGIAAADAAAPFAGETRPLCDRKHVPLSAGQNAAAEFWVMTDVPVVGNISGVILNDLGNEFNPNSPAFGEKYAPPNVPVGFYDWNGKEVARVYADKYGRYNAVVPSTFTTNLPQPSGMSPNMLVSCMNDAGTGTDPDPFWNPQFSQFCYTFQYMPGVITYLDTPVVPIAAFASPVTYPVDCEMPASTPRISHVTRRDNTGPYALEGETIDVYSMGPTLVANPSWDGGPTGRLIERDYSFVGCTVELEDELGNRVGLANPACAADVASGDVPVGTPAGAYQVVVTNGDGAETPTGVTLTVGPYPNNQSIWHVPGDFSTIQAAIDGAAAGDLILVGPKADGTAYDELVIMYKPVKLQAWGPGAVTINGRQTPTEKVNNWRTKAQFLLASGAISQLPGQAVGVAGFAALAEAIFPTEEGAAIFVAGKSNGGGRFDQNRYRGARIDGFTIIGASTGGGIVVNGYAPYLQIGNNRVVGNGGAFGGGIRIGHPQLSHQEPNGTLVYDDARNDFIRIHHNHIAMNGGRGGAGGGVSLHTGADDYTVEKNRICGNFSSGNGGGIGHLGVSDRGLIADNEIIFNESFSQADAQSGGGIFIGGQAQLDPAALQVSPGTGSVTIDSNLIRGNLAGAGDGGGIQLASVNGTDVLDNDGDAQSWYQVDVINNMINNNVAALAGGGIAIQDSVRVNIVNNTVAHNDSTATAALAFSPGVPNQSNATPAGIVSRMHTGDFGILMGTATVPDPDWALFSDAAISDSIVEHNRSFYWLNFDDGDPTNGIDTGLFPATCTSAPIGCDALVVEDYTVDLGVMSGPFTVADSGLVGQLDPQYSLLTDTTGYAATNVSGNPGFVNPYFNGPFPGLDIPEFTTISTAGAFDEGGNFIQVAFSPLSLFDSTGAALDYHIGAGAAEDAGSNILLIDIDDDPRPQGDASDIGADEIAP